MSTITKDHLVRMMTDKNELTQKDNKIAIDSMIQAIQLSVTNGDKVVLSGFGTFKAKERTERRGLNPRTKESIHIEHRLVPTFRAGKKFKRAVNQETKDSTYNN